MSRTLNSSRSTKSAPQTMTTRLALGAALLLLALPAAAAPLAEVSDLEIDPGGPGVHGSANGLGLEINPGGLGLEINPGGLGLEINPGGLGLEINPGGLGLEINPGGLGLEINPGG